MQRPLLPFLLLLALTHCGPVNSTLDASNDSADTATINADASEDRAVIPTDVESPDVRTGPAPVLLGTTPPANLAGPVEYARALVESRQIPGAALAIISEGRLVYATGMGVRRAGRPEPVTERSLFRVGSITKMLTGALAMTLVEQGRLDLDAPVTRYVPTLQLRAPANPSQITMRMLLTHTSGLPDDLTVECPVGPDSLQLLARMRTDTPLWAPPGRVWNYSNLGVSLAGYVAETIIGSPFDTALRDRVFVPGGMTTATFDARVAEAGDFTTGHVVSSAGRVGLTYTPSSYDCGGGHPVGYVLASVTDFAHWVEAMFAGGGRVMNMASTRLAMSPVVRTRGTPDEGYGFGWFVEPHRGVTAVSHNGQVLGWETAIVTVPDRRAAVLYFQNANRLDTSPESIAYGVLDRFLELSGSNPNYGTDPSTWGVYEGTYQDPINFGTVTVRRNGNELRATVSRLNAEGPLRQIAGDRFYFQGGTAFTQSFGVTFWRENNMPAEFFVTRVGVAARAP